jgi:PIN domain nuclease of toxin-antitoxin system
MTGLPFLLDTNVLIWLETKPQRIPDHVTRQIAMSPRVYLSAVSAWEIYIKQSIGSLELDDYLA